jgi:hypothetical protein
MLIDRSYDIPAERSATGIARHVECITDTTDLRHGKYNCGMAVYLDMLAGDGGEDECTGNSDMGGTLLRFGRWLVWYDEQGFVQAYKYATPGEAQAEFDRINLEICDEGTSS